MFLSGAVLAVIIRGGWRRPVGLLGFFVAFGVVAGPWYIYHAHDLIQTFTSIAQLYVNPVQSPPRWSLASFGWYFWNLVNEQAMVPFTVLFLIGVVMAIRRCIKDRLSSSSVLPEILAGLLVSYLGMTYLTHKDPRYSLPGLVYVAVLGTFWIPQIARTRVRAAVTIAFIAIAAVQFRRHVHGTRRYAQDHGLAAKRRKHDDLPAAVHAVSEPGMAERRAGDGREPSSAARRAPPDGRHTCRPRPRQRPA